MAPPITLIALARPSSSITVASMSVFVCVAVILSSPLCHCQNLRLRGFSGSLYDRIVNNYAPTLGVNPSFLGVTSPPQVGLQNQFQQPRSFANNPAVVNSLGSTTYQQQPGSSIQSQQQSLLANLISQYQEQQNPDLKAQFRTEIERLLAQTSAAGAANADPASRLLPYLNFLNTASRNPGLSSTLLGQLQRQAALTSTTTTTTTPSPAQSLLAQAARNPALLQHLLSLARQAQTTTTTSTTTQAPTTPYWLTTTTPSPTSPPTVGIPSFLLQQFLAATSTTPEPTTLAPTTTTNAPLLPYDFSKDPALYQQFLQFIQQQKQAALGLTEESTTAAPSTTTAMTTTTITEAPTTPSTTTVAEEVGDTAAERQILKHVLSRVLDSLLQEEKTAPSGTTLPVNDFVETTTTTAYLPSESPRITQGSFEPSNQVETTTAVPAAITTDPESLFKQLLALSGNGQLEQPTPAPFDQFSTTTVAPATITTTDPESLFSQLLALSGVTPVAKDKVVANENVVTVSPIQTFGNTAGLSSTVLETTTLPSTTTKLPANSAVNQPQQQGASAGDMWNNEFHRLTRMQQWAQNQALLKQFEAQRQLVLNSTRRAEEPSTPATSWRSASIPTTVRPDAIQQRASDSSSGQYSFSYVGKDSAKQETRDLSGNVRGSYLYRDSNNQVQQVRYVGNEQGFQVSGTNSPTINAVMDTPEVAAAKVAHFKEVAKIKADQARRQALKELIEAASQTKG